MEQLTNIIRVEQLPTIKNKELRKNLNAMAKAIEMGNKSGWQYAMAINEIVKKEQFKGDFKNYNEFAKFVGMTKGTISQYTGAVDFITTNELVIRDEKGGIDFGKIYVNTSAAYILSTLKDNYNDFVAWLAEQGIDNVFSLSVAKLKKAIKVWKGEEEPENVVEGEAVEGEAVEGEVTAEEVEEALEERGRALTVIASMVKRYGFTWKDIKEAMR